MGVLCWWEGYVEFTEAEAKLKRQKNRLKRLRNQDVKEKFQLPSFPVSSQPESSDGGVRAELALLIASAQSQCG